MKNKQTIFFGLAAVALVFFLIWSYTAVGGMTYSEGERTGSITKFSYKGMMVKSWEGELNTGGMEQGGVASVWKFSVSDESVVEKVQEAQRAGGRWTLKYEQQFMQQSWRGATSYFITDVQQAGQ